MHGCFFVESFLWLDRFRGKEGIVAVCGVLLKNREERRVMKKEGKCGLCVCVCGRGEKRV